MGRHECVGEDCGFWGKKPTEIKVWESLVKRWVRLMIIFHVSSWFCSEGDQVFHHRGRFSSEADIQRCMPVYCRKTCTFVNIFNISNLKRIESRKLRLNSPISFGNLMFDRYELLRKKMVWNQMKMAVFQDFRSINFEYCRTRVRKSQQPFKRNDLRLSWIVAFSTAIVADLASKFLSPSTSK